MIDKIDNLGDLDHLVDSVHELGRSLERSSVTFEEYSNALKLLAKEMASDLVEMAESMQAEEDQKYIDDVREFIEYRNSIEAKMDQ